MTIIKSGKAFNALLIFAALVLNIAVASAQTNYHSKSVVATIKGTSNVHDWEMKGSSGESEAIFVIDKEGKLSSITKLSFSLPVKSLKSEHKGMDNNTYKALREPKNPNMQFVLTSVKVTPGGENNYNLSGQGNLTIAGKTNATNIVATALYNPVTKSFMISGVKKMKMTEYDVSPPKALFGTITTGNAISVGYTVTYLPQ